TALARRCGPPCSRCPSRPRRPPGTAMRPYRPGAGRPAPERRRRPRGWKAGEEDRGRAWEGAQPSSARAPCPWTAEGSLTERMVNRLAREASPYLQQHSKNPVDWYPWGPEALERAQREDRPILLSIGYSACHWCHVMERESFRASGPH